MAIVLADRIKETTSSKGTDNFQLTGAVTGFQTFFSGVGTGNETYYCCTDGNEWEVGTGTLTGVSVYTLSRDTIHSSSNGGAKVIFPSGVKDIFAVAPATFLSQSGGAHNHDGLYEPLDNTILRDADIGTGAGQVSAGNHGHASGEITGLGDAATKNTGTSAGELSAGNHLHTGTYQPVGSYVLTSDIGTSVATQAHVHTGTYEPVFSKNTGFNLNLGTTASTVSEGDHTHTGVYEPVFTKNTGFNKNFGTGADDVAIGDHLHSGNTYPITVEQIVSNQTSSAGTIVATLPSTPTQNNVLIAIVSQQSSVAANLLANGATWNEVVSEVTPGTATLKIFWKLVTTASDPTAYTFDGTASSAMMIRLLEYSGLNEVDPFDVANGSYTNANTNADVGLVTTTQDDSLLLAAWLDTDAATYPDADPDPVFDNLPVSWGWQNPGVKEGDSTGVMAIATRLTEVIGTYGATVDGDATYSSSNILGGVIAMNKKANEFGYSDNNHEHTQYSAYILNKDDATAAPTSTDDINAGYSVGSWWVDTTNDRSYICVNSNASAAIWHTTENAKHNTAAADPTGTDDSASGYSLGSVWVNSATDQAFICADATAASAIWLRISTILHKFDATAAPASATDDVTLGYEVGSLWFDTTGDEFYVCLDNTDGAAVWRQFANYILHNFNASVAPAAATDDVTLGYVVGSQWFDTTADKFYICLDNTDGAAVWQQFALHVVHKLDATAAPVAATDDITLGYTVGSQWIDITNDNFYICVDNTDGAAVWLRMETDLVHKFDATAAPASATDDVTLGYTVGSQWIDVTNDEFYMCVDNTDANAVWLNMVTATSTQTVANKTLDDCTLQSYKDTVVSPTITAGAATCDFNAGNTFVFSSSTSNQLNASEATTITLANIPTGGSISVYVEQATATGGAAITWQVSGGTPTVDFGNNVPTQNTNAGAKEQYVFTVPHTGEETVAVRSWDKG